MNPYAISLYLQEQMHGDFNMNKFMLPTKWQSQYGRDFPLKLKERQEIIKNTVYDDYKSPQTSEFSKTSYKSHFSAYPPKDYNPKLERRKYEKSELQFATLTTYKANHFDFQTNYKPEKVTASKHLTTGGLSLSSQSLYKTEYQWPQPIEQPTNCKNIYSKLQNISHYSKQEIQFNLLESSSINNEMSTVNSQLIQFVNRLPIHKLQLIRNSITNKILIIKLYNLQINNQTIQSLNQQLNYINFKLIIKLYVSTTKNDFQGARLGEVTQMKNWRQSVIRRMNQLRKQSQI